MKPTAESVAMAWIEKWSRPVDEHESCEPDLDFGLPESDPTLTLESILEILTRIPADSGNHHFQVLAAGPLEDLIAFHGATMLKELDLQARRNPSLRLLLNGVWFDNASEPVRQHLAKYLEGGW